VPRYTSSSYEYDDTHSGLPHSICTDRECSPRPPLDLPLSRRSWIDSEYTDETLNPKVRNGVKMGEGDGTVSLLSLGAMCVDGWKRRRWNPAGIKITTVEVGLPNALLTFHVHFAELLIALGFLCSSLTDPTHRIRVEVPTRVITLIS
jgi:hypothetical protein